jgi:hypothetical protein
MAESFGSAAGIQREIEDFTGVSPSFGEAGADSDCVRIRAAIVPTTSLTSNSRTQVPFSGRPRGQARWVDWASRVLGTSRVLPGIDRDAADTTDPVRRARLPLFLGDRLARGRPLANQEWPRSRNNDIYIR